MSRTKKDRPQWVIANDTTFDRRQEKHDHTRLGGEVLRWRFRCDDEGNRVIETHIESNHLWDETISEWVKITTVNRFYIREKYISHTIADECTINKPLTDHYRWFYDKNPCAYVVYNTKTNRPRSDEKKAFHSKKRSNELAPLRLAAKMYNSGEDIDGYDDPALNDRTTMHNGYWD